MISQTWQIDGACWLFFGPVGLKHLTYMITPEKGIYQQKLCTVKLFGSVQMMKCVRCVCLWNLFFPLSIRNSEIHKCSETLLRCCFTKLFKSIQCVRYKCKKLMDLDEIMTRTSKFRHSTPDEEWPNQPVWTSSLDDGNRKSTIPVLQTHCVYFSKALWSHVWFEDILHVQILLHVDTQFDWANRKQKTTLNCIENVMLLLCLSCFQPVVMWGGVQLTNEH